MGRTEEGFAFLLHETPIFMATPSSLLERNRAWSDRMQAERPELLDELSKGQAPDVLWIGCADSRVPASQIVDVDPGELFVHRNVANVVSESDVNGMSVLQYAVESLQVPHIIVCGHYGCGGVQAVLSDATSGALTDWLAPVKEMIDEHASDLAGLSDEARWKRGCELNVEAQVTRLAHSSIVEAAWERGQTLSVHGWIYRLESGRIHDLDVTVTSDTFA